ncbi:hypothetical protein Tco_1399037, partial [Tanacetum coccineum]
FPMTGSLGGLGGSLWPAMNDLFHLIVYMKMKGKVMTNAVERNHGGKNVKISMEVFLKVVYFVFVCDGMSSIYSGNEVENI